MVKNTLFNITRDIFLEKTQEKVSEYAALYKVVLKPDVKEGIYGRY